MKKRYQVIIGVGIITGALLYLFLSSFSGTAVYYYTIEELEGLQVDPAQKIRVSGELLKNSVEYNPAEPILKFILQSEDSTVRIQVSYRDVMPDNFMNSEELVVTGYLDGDKLIAENMLIKCPSKYEAEPKRE